MSEQTLIEHTGVVTDIDEQLISVRIENESCHDCRMKAFCGVTDAERNTFTIDAKTQTLTYHKGDHVKLTISLNAGYKALFWAYLMPFLLVAFAIVLTLSVGVSEKWAGVIGLSTLIPYYMILNKTKSTFSKKFKLDIMKYE